jgi:putative SOS response-associated peptidase YedK
VPASYFFEWTAIEGQPKKQRWQIQRQDGEPLVFAGLWDTWRPPEGDPVRSCTIITTEANVLMSSIHNRMPVILDAEAAAEWLDPATPTAELQHLLRACPDLWLEAHPA